MAYDLNEVCNLRIACAVNDPRAQVVIAPVGMRDKAPTPWEAELQARDLLLSYLNGYQRWMLGNFGCFYERAADSGSIFALGSGYFMIRTEDKQPVEWRGLFALGYNPHPMVECTIPKSDSLLSQVLILRAAPYLLEHSCKYDHSHQLQAQWGYMWGKEALRIIESGRYCWVK